MICVYIYIYIYIYIYKVCTENIVGSLLLKHADPFYFSKYRSCWKFFKKLSGDWWSIQYGAFGPVGWDCRIYRRHLCRGLSFPQITLNNNVASVMLELWRMQSTPSLPSFLGPFCSGLVAPNRVQSMGQKELNCVLMLNWIVWKRTVFDI